MSVVTTPRVVQVQVVLSTVTLWADEERNDEGKVTFTSYHESCESCEQSFSFSLRKGKKARAVEFEFQPAGFRTTWVDIPWRRQDAGGDWIAKHTLDLPQQIVSQSEESWEDTSEMTRASGFQEVAETNADELGGHPRFWLALLEIGQIFEASSFRTHHLDNGIGYIADNIDRLIRIVRPTAEEIKRYAAVAVEGGER